MLYLWLETYGGSKRAALLTKFLKRTKTPNVPHEYRRQSVTKGSVVIYGLVPSANSTNQDVYETVYLREEVVPTRSPFGRIISQTKIPEPEGKKATFISAVEVKTFRAATEPPLAAGPSPTGVTSTDPLTSPESKYDPEAVLDETLIGLKVEKKVKRKKNKPTRIYVRVGFVFHSLAQMPALISLVSRFYGGIGVANGPTWQRFKNGVVTNKKGQIMTDNVYPLASFDPYKNPRATGLKMDGINCYVMVTWYAGVVEVYEWIRSRPGLLKIAAIPREEPLVTGIFIAEHMHPNTVNSYYYLYDVLDLGWRRLKGIKSEHFVKRRSAGLRAWLNAYCGLGGDYDGATVYWLEDVVQFHIRPFLKVDASDPLGSIMSRMNEAETHKEPMDGVIISSMASLENIITGSAGSESRGNNVYKIKPVKSNTIDLLQLRVEDTVQFHIKDGPTTREFKPPFFIRMPKVSSTDKRHDGLVVEISFEPIDNTNRVYQGTVVKVREDKAGKPNTQTTAISTVHMLRGTTEYHIKTISGQTPQRAFRIVNRAKAWTIAQSNKAVSKAAFIEPGGGRGSTVGLYDNDAHVLYFEPDEESFKELQVRIADKKNMFAINAKIPTLSIKVPSVRGKDVENQLRAIEATLPPNTDTPETLAMKKYLAEAAAFQSAIRAFRKEHSRDKTKPFFNRNSGYRIINLFVMLTALHEAEYESFMYSLVVGFSPRIVNVVEFDKEKLVVPWSELGVTIAPSPVAPGAARFTFPESALVTDQLVAWPANIPKLLPGVRYTRHSIWEILRRSRKVGGIPTESELSPAERKYLEMHTVASFYL